MSFNDGWQLAGLRNPHVYNSPHTARHGLGSVLDAFCKSYDAEGTESKQPEGSSARSWSHKRSAHFERHFRTHCIADHRQGKQLTASASAMAAGVDIVGAAILLLHT